MHFTRFYFVQLQYAKIGYDILEKPIKRFKANMFILRILIQFIRIVIRRSS